MQVTRDKLLRDHLYNEKVDISRGTGSGYPAGIQCMTSFFQHMYCTPGCGCSSSTVPGRKQLITDVMELGL